MEIYTSGIYLSCKIATCRTVNRCNVFDHRRFAICIVRLSMYICRVSLPEISLSTSAWTPLALAIIAVIFAVSPLKTEILRLDRTDHANPPGLQ